MGSCDQQGEALRPAELITRGSCDSPVGHCISITLSELWLQRHIQEFDDPFAIDDHGGQQILNLHAQPAPIADPPPVVPTDQVGQFPLDAGMLPAHRR